MKFNISDHKSRRQTLEHLMSEGMDFRQASEVIVLSFIHKGIPLIKGFKLPGTKRKHRDIQIITNDKCA